MSTLCQMNCHRRLSIIRTRICNNLRKRRFPFLYFRISKVNGGLMIEVVGEWLEVDGERLSDLRVTGIYFVDADGQRVTISGDQYPPSLFTRCIVEINSLEAFEIMVSHKFGEIPTSIGRIYYSIDDQDSL